MGFTRIFEKNDEKKCEHWSENEFTSFGENAITSIFAKGWNSLGFSKKMVKKTAKIGQKMNSVSYLLVIDDQPFKLLICVDNHDALKRR